MKLTPDIYFREVPKTVDMNIRSELYSTNEFTFAVAVILSAQATDKKVNEVTPGLFAIADTPEKMLALGETGLKQHIKVISFFNNKARNIIALSRKLEERRAKVLTVISWKILSNNSSSLCALRSANSILPRTREELTKLPGIGQKTANVIMNVLYGAPMIGVDTHVFRNAHRYGWCGKDCNTPEKVEAALLKIIPKKYHGMVNHVMVLHGRYTCKALRPNCAECPVAKWCEFR